MMRHGPARAVQCSLGGTCWAVVRLGGSLVLIAESGIALMSRLSGMRTHQNTD